jgi:hypothetical protein
MECLERGSKVIQIAVKEVAAHLSVYWKSFKLDKTPEAVC